MKILIINGPNLNLLGIREPDIYGSESLSDIENWLNDQPESDGHSITWFQSNHEGELIDFIHGAMGNVGGIVINPGAFTHYSYAIRDAISAINVPTVEVHLSDINTREDFREISVIKDVCLDQISGLGKIGYLKGIQRLIN
ncbi:MAG: type II 3-dehydroquinate dehydratase [Candidatus Marinimicrobia bacterium]|nr:type II 3-dehydroquinate dehydratase [Candidatus Neomarinimicrobiota bacterium]MBT3947199.1 type II 3-dehydroquinate dehydratase [Candidatus Neomarinimicrobiota bacterium]MBT4065034.1 type II 3-dehydroquinate dehydratase [Candidatus Neomarinimicrobiota bacterium]MBT4307604.1 type II 3-dehydroquinate dehydratase [Candidatus Neomarinimicrobiota bacterium]MBT4452861.1 type II 3-dehydroquinate dehydratase [Candidatus Neomarinimicrobiota bacterium]